MIIYVYSVFLFEQCTTYTTVCGSLSYTSVAGLPLSCSYYFLNYKILGHQIHKWLLRTCLAIVPALRPSDRVMNTTLLQMTRIPSLLGED